MGSIETNPAMLSAWERLARAARSLVPGFAVEDRWRALFRVHHYEGRETVLHPGENHQVVFVARGFVRFYTATDSGEERNQFFAVAGDFVHTFLAEQQGVPYGAEALEPSDILGVNLSDWESLGQTDAGPLVRAVKSRMLEHKARHSYILQHRDTVERIAALREWKPEWWVRAPQYHLANYLGVSEVTLSRAVRRGNLSV